MNEFDLLLESELRRLLAPVVAAPAPRRRGAVDIRKPKHSFGRGGLRAEDLVPIRVEIF
ncbi:MAG TPA: hypothetical protein VFD88_14340 [Clostridia bacterium]|nr:hypothetical protein [Clostridia bacterium]